MIEIKRKLFVSFAFMLLAVLFVTSTSGLAEAKARKKEKPNEKYAALIVDVGTGAVLHQENASKSLHPASLTKMMTLLMLFEAMDHGKVSATDRITISSHAAGMPPSKLGLKVGSTIKVEDAIYALVTKSANDIAVAVGEHLGKTESNFARMMTKKAQEIGMTKTVFKNASGLHNPGQVTTARDMGKLGLMLVTQYGEYYHYFSKRSFQYRGATYQNHNRLMQTYKGMDGMKTGYINPSGFNLVASAKQNGQRLIGVVFGGRTAVSRNERMRVLLDDGFAKLRSRGAPALVASADAMRLPQAAAPVPGRKPGTDPVALTFAPDRTEQEIALQSRSLQERVLMDTKPENMQFGQTSTSRWAMLEEGPSGALLTRMSGEGDFDNDVRTRLETGLIAVSAHTGHAIPARISGNTEVVETPIEAAVVPVRHTPSASDADWAIQVGAFTSRDSTDKAIASSLKQLPQHLRSGSAIIAPVQTPQGWIFRARLHGYTKDGAEQACSILSECIAIAPYIQ